MVVPLNVTSNAVVLFPLTTQEPGPERLSVRVLPGSYHIEPITHDPFVYAYGQFSQAFMRQVLRILAQAIRAERLTIVRRQD